MKFVPRQPPPPPVRPNSRTTTTRFLRLREADDVNPPAGDGVKFEPRPLPEYMPPPPKTSGRPGSGRLRLRLDPEVASQPLPPAPQEAAPISHGVHSTTDSLLAEQEPESAYVDGYHEAAEHSASLEAINDVALVEVATAEPEAGTEYAEPEYTAPEYVQEAPQYPAETHAVDHVEQAEVVETLAEPVQPDLFEIPPVIPPVAETVAQVWTAPGPVEEAVDGVASRSGARTSSRLGTCTRACRGTGA